MKEDIRLIAIDLDGTLINNEKILTPFTKKALLDAIEKGAKVVPATGRAITGIPDYLKDIPLEYGIFCNGASVYDLKKNDEIYSDRFTIEEALEILDECEKLDCIISHAADGKMYTSLEDKNRISNYNIREVTQDVILTTRIFVEDLREQILQATSGVDKFVLFVSSQEKKAELMDYFRSKGKYHVVTSLLENLEIGKKTCNKGVALSHLANHLKLSPKHIMSFGDADNDKEMIEFAGIGVAMENALPEILEVSNYVTASNNEDGVAKAIYKFME